MNNPPLNSTQQFNVNAPRFALPPGIVHSTYPPQGLGDHNNILPHMVFEDVHFPWEQSGSPRQDEDDEKSGVDPRNKVPWVALLTFTEDELKLGETTDLMPKSKSGLFPEVIQIPIKSIPPPPGRDQDKSTFSVQLTMGEYLEMGGDVGTGTAIPATVITPIIDNSAEKIDRTTQVNVIFPQASLVQDLLRPYDVNGQKMPIPDVNNKPVAPDLSRYKYLAHVRNVNTQNVAGAGSNDDGLFSVVYAHRSGPLDITTAQPVIVHLVTLEGFEVPYDQQPHITLPLDSTKRVALVSLYSWTYLCLPPSTVNFVDSLRHIGFDIEAGNCWLRTAPEILSKFTDTLLDPTTHNPVPVANYTVPQQMASRIADRLTDGFCLQRYRLQTGEETVAFCRGPFSPTYQKPITDAWWPYQSNFSSDYQILDRKLGIVDISYSAAWQLGRTLAIADQAYAAALVRLRGLVQTTARRGTLKVVTPRPAKSKAEVLSTLAASVKHLSMLAGASPQPTPSPPQLRHTRQLPKAPQFQLKQSNSDDANPPIQLPPETVRDALFRHHVQQTSTKLASARFDLLAMSATTPSDDDEVYIPWSDITVPTSPDWQIVQNWILDNMFFKNIPAHYYIPDPSYLPPESVRFFYIDPELGRRIPRWCAECGQPP